LNSFNETYKLYPHQLQLGFLKLLKGSGIRREYQKYGYKFRQYPPYEVLSNAYLSFGDIIKLKKIEELLERYYNSGRFQRTLKYLIEGFFPSPAAFFEESADKNCEFHICRKIHIFRIQNKYKAYG